jgi:hypothetical protein
MAALLKLFNGPEFEAVALLLAKGVDPHGDLPGRTRFGGGSIGSSISQFEIRVALEELVSRTA